MANVVAADIPEWEAARIKSCYREFIGQKCVKNGNEELNADAENFDESQLDEEKMQSRILDLIAALGVVRRRRRQAKRSLLTRNGQPMSPEMETVWNKVFKTMVISFLDKDIVNDGTKMPERIELVDRVMRAFPDSSKLTDGRGWLPLHWTAASVASEEKEQINKETNMKVLYAIDPMALQRYHLEGTAMNNMGLTPAHLLCMHQMTNRRSMSLIRHFSICNQQAFIMSTSYPNRGDPSLYGCSALHAACGPGQPTEELLKHLLQLDSSQTKRKCSKNGLTPLGYLHTNRACSDQLVTCLLDVDSSTEVVWNGIAGCLQCTDCSRMLGRVEMLLKANPEAAKYRTSPFRSNILHAATRSGKVSPQICIGFMKQVHDIHKDAVREVTLHGSLPVHTAARSSTVEVMEFLLGLYSESASVVTTDGSDNLLHLAVFDTENTTSVMEAKVRFLCSRYPAMMLQRDKSGSASLHFLSFFKNIPVMQILCEIGGQEQMRLPIAHPTKANYSYNGWLPLHLLIGKNAEALRDSLPSKAADCFRLFLRMYPEAAGIEGGTGARNKTPYQLAVDENLPPYYLRLLLRAAPNLNPAELHRLNYAERRMAMFLAFGARTSAIDPPFLARLRFEKMDLVKHVMSFL